MTLVLNEEQAMLRDAAEGFIGQHGPVAHLRTLRDDHDVHGYSRELWRAFSEMGFTGLLAEESHGGSGLGLVEAGVIMQALGRNLTPTPFLATAVLGVSALSLGGSEAQKAAWLSRFIRGDALAALAVDDAPRHRPDRLSLTAQRDGDALLLNGTKVFVVDGHVADVFIVATGGDRAAPNDAMLLLVPAKTAGLTIERTAMVDSHNAARLTFDGVRIEADAVLAQGGGGRVVLDRLLDIGRALTAAQLSGLAQEVADRTCVYLKERRQFGRLIGEFQALQHRAAHLHCEIAVTKAAVAGALLAIDTGDEGAALAVAAAKARAGATAALAVQEAVQMHGGVGMTDEYDIGLFMKRAKVLDALFGDTAWQADRFARLGGY